MKKRDVYAYPETAGIQPLVFDPDICSGCGICIEVCQVDVMIPAAAKGKPPIVLYPGECWYCGCCEAACPRPGAVLLNIPLMNRVGWKEKE